MLPASGWVWAILFWILFALSLALYERYPGLDTAWYAAGKLVLLLLAVVSLVRVIRHRDRTEAISYQGLPRWLLRFLMDEDDDEPGPTRTQ